MQNHRKSSLTTNVEAGFNGQDTPTQPPSTTTKPHHRWYHWYEPGLSTKEKRLIFKLDAVILFYTCLTFFIKYLEETSVTNAYVSGMRKDLHLHGNELNWFSTYYNIGTIVGAPFATFVLTFIPPMYWLPTCTILSSVFVLGMYKAESAATIYGLRFATGLASSAVMPGSFYLIGSWYTKYEIARRSAIFQVSSYVGGMISGYVQAGLYTSLNGRNGLAAWRWLFIVNAILGVPVALLGVLMCPNEPKSRKRWWMTAEERELCMSRMGQEDQTPLGSLDLSIIKRVLTSWQFYCFVIAYATKELTCGVEMTRWLTLFLSSAHYSVPEVNTLSTTVPCVEIVVTFVASVVTDSTQRPGLIILVIGSLQLYGYAVLLAWPSSQAFKFSTYLIAGGFYSGLGPIINAWANSRCGHDKYLRAITTAMITTMGYVCETLAQQFFFPVSDAPTFKKSGGYIWGLCWVIVAVAFSGGLIPVIEAYFTRRNVRRHECEDLSGNVQEDSSSADHK